MEQNQTAKPTIDALKKKLNEAIEIAQEAHYGQFDQAGQHYFAHPEAVSQIVSDVINHWPEKSEEFLVKAQIVSYLHDVIEDTVLTAEDLREREFPEDCVEAVVILTWKTNQDYLEYIDAVRANKLARCVKIADLTHNSDLSRLNQVSEKDLTRLEKYRISLAKLTDFSAE